MKILKTAKSTIKLLNGDCLRHLTDIPDKSIDFVLTDPPYSTTACKWDCAIPLRLMWKELIRVTKPGAAIALFGSEPFSSRLRLSFIDGYKYDWYWRKDKASNFLQGNNRPMNPVEIVSVFTGYKAKINYYPQKIKNPKGSHTRHLRSYAKQSENSRKTSANRERCGPGKNYEPDKLLPVNILEFCRDIKPIHPTQKPVPLLKYLIKTYTLEGQVVLDFTMGSGSTGVAAVETNRDFVGIELEKEYFGMAEKRIYEARKS